MDKSEMRPMLPTEPFWEAIVAEQMEERLEFEPWATTTETVTITETCTRDGCQVAVRGTVAITDGPWDT